MSIKTADDKNFSLFLKDNKAVLLKMGALWCGPCKAIKPTLEAVAQERSDSLLVLEMDIDDSPMVPRSLKVMSVPTMILFLDGKEVSRRAGNISRQELNSWIDLEIKK